MKSLLLKRDLSQTALLVISPLETELNGSHRIPLLLKGTQREYLLQSGQLQEIEIRQEQLEQFDEIRVINALNEL